MIAKHIVRAVHVIGLMAGRSIVWTANINGQSIHPPIGTPLPELPQVVSPFELQAINDRATGKGAFVFEGYEVPPVVRAMPGGAIRLEYVNQMSTSFSELCVACMNMTNLHFHGLHVSPCAPGDDVLTMMARLVNHCTTPRTFLLISLPDCTGITHILMERVTSRTSMGCRAQS
jgi:hypothetical protein